MKKFLFNLKTYLIFYILLQTITLFLTIIDDRIINWNIFSGVLIDTVWEFTVSLIILFKIK